MEKINAKLSLCIQADEIYLTIFDDDSRIQFLKIRLTPEQTILLLANRGEVPAKEAVVLGLDKVGLCRETRAIEFPLPAQEGGFTNAKLAKEIAAQFEPEGWVMDTSFGSQSSFKTVKGVTYACTHIHRWVKKPTTDTK